MKYLLDLDFFWDTSERAGVTAAGVAGDSAMINKVLVNKGILSFMKMEILKILSAINHNP